MVKSTETCLHCKRWLIFKLLMQRFEIIWGTKTFWTPLRVILTKLRFSVVQTELLMPLLWNLLPWLKEIYYYIIAEVKVKILDGSNCSWDHLLLLLQRPRRKFWTDRTSMLTDCQPLCWPAEWISAPEPRTISSGRRMIRYYHVFIVENRELEPIIIFFNAWNISFATKCKQANKIKFVINFSECDYIYVFDLRSLNITGILH